MKKLFMLGLVAMVAACSSSPKETYPYGLSESEWNQLSIKDKTRIRRDFYFYEKGQVNIYQKKIQRKVETKSLENE